jgi:hypothetical protein
VRYWRCEFVPARAMRTRTNAPCAKVSVGQRQLTESLLTTSAVEDRLRKARDGARLRRSPCARDCQRPHVPRVRTRRDARADAKAHQAMLQIWRKGSCLALVKNRWRSLSWPLQGRNWQVRAHPSREVHARSQRGTQALAWGAAVAAGEFVSAGTRSRDQLVEMANTCCCCVAPTSFQCAARGLHAAQGDAARPLPRPKESPEGASCSGRDAVASALREARKRRVRHGRVPAPLES